MTAGPGAYRSGALLFFGFGSWAGSSFFVRLLALHDALAGQQLDGFPDGTAFIAIFKNSAYQNSIFAICSLRMLLVH